MTAVPPPPFHPHPAPAPPKKGLGGCAIAGIGCGVVALVCLIGLVAAVWWAASNWQNLAADLGTYGASQMVEASDLPADQKTRIVARLNQVNSDFQAGRITAEQLGRVVETAMQSPLLHLGMVEFAEQRYLAPNPDLTEEEKQAGRRSLERFARGIYEGKLAPEAFDQIAAPMMTTDSAGEQHLKDNPTADEVREMLRLANEAANEVAVPDEPFEINIADEFDRAVDQALAEPAVDEAPTDPVSSD